MATLKRIEKIVRENAFDEKKKRPGLKFNPGLALIGLRTTGPWGRSCREPARPLVTACILGQISIETWEDLIYLITMAKDLTGH